MDKALDINVTLALPDFRLEVQDAIPLDGVTAITGASGSGKTTLLRVLAGLEPRAKGRIRFAGQTWLDGSTHLPTPLRRLGVVFQDARLFPHLDVAGNLAYGARRRGVSSAHIARVAEALKITPLLTRSVSALSGGEQRRVAVARALASDPQLLLLDEPLSGLDADLRDTTLRVIADAVRDLAVPAVYVSHSEVEVAALADRVLGVAQGRGLDQLVSPVVVQADARSDGKSVMLHLGGAVFPPPVGTQEGARVALAIAPGDLMLSQNSPGHGTAAFSLPATVRSASPDGHVTMKIDDQLLTIPLSGPLLVTPPTPGQTLWITVRKCWSRGPVRRQ